MANTLVPAKAEAPSDAQLRAELAAEREARQRAEQDREQLRIAAHTEWSGRTAAENRLRQIAGQKPDPFETLSTEGIAVPPEKQKELLDRGVRERTREELSVYDKARRQEDAQRAVQSQVETAATIFASMNPQIVADEDRFAGAVTQAQRKAARERLNVSPAETLEIAKGIYLEQFKAPPGVEVPYTEGASMPGMPGGRGRQQAEEPTQTMVEEAYGLDPGTILPDAELENHTKRYIDERNMGLERIEKFGSNIRQVKATIIEGRKRAAAAAAGR